MRNSEKYLFLDSFLTLADLFFRREMRVQPCLAPTPKGTP